MSASEYNVVPQGIEADIERVSNEISDAENLLISRSSRWVLFLCFIQMVMSVISLLGGGLITMIISTLFISIGIVGITKRRFKLITVHFFYSLVLYIFSLIGVVLLVLYCDAKHEWWVYTIGFFVILFQAVGMKHSRIIICILRKAQSHPVCVVVPQESKSFENNVPIYPIPSTQFVPMQMQPQMMMNPSYYPQFYPVQFPMNVNGEQQVQQPIGFFPIVQQKQI